jgi:hypothetical protein
MIDYEKIKQGRRKLKNGCEHYLSIEIKTLQKYSDEIDKVIKKLEKGETKEYLDYLKDLRRQYNNTIESIRQSTIIYEDVLKPFKKLFDKIEKEEREKDWKEYNRDKSKAKLVSQIKNISIM